MVYKKRAYAKKRVVRRRARAPSTKKKPTFEKRVKSVISRMAENKVQNHTNYLQLQAYGATNWGLTITPMTPDTLYMTILQGAGQGQRIGNSIRVKSLRLTGVLRALPYNLTTNGNPVPVYVKLMFLTRKDTPTELYNSLTDVLQLGNDSISPGTSAQIERMQRPVNTDVWTYHTSRTFKVGYSSYSGTSFDEEHQIFANNDFKMNQFVNIDLTKFCTKNIKFDDNTANPSTRNIVMYPILYTAHGIEMGPSQVPVGFNYSIDIVYEDM